MLGFGLWVSGPGVGKSQGIPKLEQSRRGSFQKSAVVQEVLGTEVLKILQEGFGKDA